jgi:hypothetical protein
MGHPALSQAWTHGQLQNICRIAVGAGVLIANCDNALQLSNLARTKFRTIGRVLITLTLVGALVGPSAST